MKKGRKKFGKPIIILAFFAVITACLPGFLFAATSDNYGLEQESAGAVELTASSSNYTFKAIIGEPVAGESTSTNYVVKHGQFWTENVGSEPTVTVQWAVPELRSGTAGTNDDMLFYLTVRSLAGNTLFTSSIVSTTAAGVYATPIALAGILPGVYNVTIKGHQHLTKQMSSINLLDGNNVLNFTQTDNSPAKGAVTLYAGDINGNTTTPSQMGDDKVNSLDLTALLAVYNSDDPTGNAVRANLNQDAKVNALDLTTVLKNFNAVGD